MGSHYTKYIIMLSVGIGLALIIIGIIIYIALLKPNGILQNLPNIVTATSPQNGAANVSNDSQITITFAKPVPNAALVQVSATPAFAFGYGVTSKLPSQTFTIKPTGLLLNNTEYAVNIAYDGKLIYQFQFQTVVQQQTQSDPESVKQGVQEALKYLPLVYVMPYNSANIHAEYVGPLQVQITIKKGTQAQAEQEFDAFMKRNGVDPSTHKLTFVQQ